MKFIVSVMTAALLAGGCTFESVDEQEQEEVYAEVTEEAVGASLDVSVDVLGIANAIADAVKSSQNRTGWVKNVMNTAWYGAHGKYNVMVFNLNQDYEARLKGVKFYGSAVYSGITFGIWIFEDGKFINKGDGGWINWAFSGRFKRRGHQGHEVTFSKI